MSEELKLGQIITTDQHRDAIHIAVVPVIAAGWIHAGARLRLVEGSTEKVTTVRGPGSIGVADPFLNGAVEEGQRFWMYLNPGSITSLRHEWTHPAFDGAAEQSTNESPQDVSRKWIEAFAARLDQTYSRLMAAAERWVETDDGKWGGEYTRDDSETYKDYWDQFPAFWQHYEVVTGKKPTQAEAFFSCSC